MKRLVLALVLAVSFAFGSHASQRAQNTSD